jgi:hypothetical protein
MHITFTPEDNPDDGWTKEFLPRKLPLPECEAIEKASGMNYGEWVDAVQSGHAGARKILWWFLVRRQHPRLRLDEVPPFGWDELQIEYSVRELRKLREEAVKSRTMTEDQRSARLSLIDDQIEEMAEKFGDEAGDGDGAGPGKARSNGSANGMPSTLLPSSV